mmetsp:Transcript_9289/g.20255  ORF Transcript_9289/g.20255 Transcript_9289/m.20255 type:complete len:214 (-) Transcript_9289:111-752(-)
MGLVECSTLSHIAPHHRHIAHAIHAQLVHAGGTKPHVHCAATHAHKGKHIAAHTTHPHLCVTQECDLLLLLCELLLHQQRRIVAIWCPSSRLTARAHVAERPRRIVKVATRQALPLARSRFAIAIRAFPPALRRWRPRRFVVPVLGGGDGRHTHTCRAGAPLSRGHGRTVRLEEVTGGIARVINRDGSCIAQAGGDLGDEVLQRGLVGIVSGW